MSSYEYKAAKYDRVGFWAEKGTRAKYQRAAALVGLGQSEMLRRAVDEFIARHVGTAEGAALHGDETPPQPAETTEIGNVGEGIPIIINGGNQTAQNQQVSAQVQTIAATAEGAPNRITAADKRLVDAVNALSPESKKALLKFLATLQA